jgi:hypothetical protein
MNGHPLFVPTQPLSVMLIAAIPSGISANSEFVTMFIHFMAG